jgi:hypothetical protein
MLSILIFFGSSPEELEKNQVSRSRGFKVSSVGNSYQRKAHDRLSAISRVGEFLLKTLVIPAKVGIQETIS